MIILFSIGGNSITIIESDCERSETMGKKFRNFVLFSAVVGAAAAGTYYFLQNKKHTEDNFSDDFDDSEDLEETDIEDTERNYVPLDLDGVKTASDKTDSTEETTQSEAIVYDEVATEQVEEFFDDEDTSSDPS